MEFTKTIDFDGLPVVGTFIKQHGGFSIAPIQLVVIPQLITRAQANLFKIPDGYPGLPAASTAGIPAGPIIIGTISLKGAQRTFTLGYRAAKKQNESGTGYGETSTQEEVPTATSAPTATSQQVGQSFGPVTIEKFSPSYSNGRIGVDISGFLSLGGIVLSLEGLKIGLPFPFDNGASFELSLQGMSVNVKEGPLTIGGGFLDVGGGDYIGAVSIQAEEFGLQAYGGYAGEGYGASFFIFVNDSLE